MPIYEFYCRDCHTVFNFYSKKVDTQKVPLCPRCRKIRLERWMSIFSVKRGGGEEGQEPKDELFKDIDHSKVEKLMHLLARESDNLNQDDPRQTAQAMRKLFQAAGLPLGEAVKEALERMEAGEELDEVEAQMGEALEGEELFSLIRKRAPHWRRERPRYEEHLYEL